MLNHIRPLVLMWHTSAILPRFISGIGQRDLYLAYGNEVPDFDPCYWMSGRYATRLRVAGIHVDLIAPGPEWLATVDRALLGRSINVHPLADLPSGYLAHVKPAQFKVVDLPAGVYYTDHYRDEARRLGVADHSLVQWADTILRLNHEHRFYVLDGQIVAGSPYLVNGQIYAPGMTSAKSDDAFSFAREAIQHLADNIPPACTFDVGYDTRSNSWVIVEANPAWSSGMYGADMHGVIETIDRSCSTDSRWMWEPDADLIRQAKQMPTMIKTNVAQSHSILSVINDPARRENV